MPKEEKPRIVTQKHLARQEKERIQNRWITIGAVIVIVLIVGVLIYGILDQTVLKGGQPVAKVGSDIITTDEFVASTRFYRWQLINQYNNTAQMMQVFGGDQQFGTYFQNQLDQISAQLNTPETAGRTTLTTLIENKLIRQEAKKLGITVTKEELDAEIEKAFGFFPNGEPTPTVAPSALPTSTISADITKLLATLTPAVPPTAEPTAEVIPTDLPTTVPTSGPTLEPSATPTLYTKDGFDKLYNEYLTTWKDIKISEQEIRKIYEDGLFRSKMSEIITKDVPRMEEQVWARHILVDDLKGAEDVLKRLKNGENWISIAAEVSKDTSNKDQGGDLGWFGKGKMVPDFEKAAFELKVGETSLPVKTDFGYHIIQVLGHENRSIEDATFTSLKDTAFSEWLTKINEATTVEEFDRWKESVPTDPTLTQ